MSSGMSVTERLEARGREAGRQQYERGVHSDPYQQRNQGLRSYGQPDRATRFARMFENSIKQQPVMWGLVCLGVGAAIGAVWLTLGRD